jgi:5-methylcytosine-specific restriction endonuclease McrA
MTEKDICRIFAKAPRTSVPGRRSRLTALQRATVLAKAASTCHVCGGSSGVGWQADHVIPHERGGVHALENYLPICRECNRLRWSYGPEVLRLIL